MKIVFISNFFNHHQQQLSEELFRLTDGEYKFFATKKMDGVRKNLGWDIDLPGYVVEVGETLTSAQRRQLDEADAVVIGGEPYAFVKNRIKSGKTVLLYSERLFKAKFRFLRKIKGLFVCAPKWHKKKAYLLCAGAYAYADFLSIGCFRERAYRWGYFPPLSAPVQWEDKEKNSLLWCARLIDWKHPEIPLEVAKRLKADGYKFTLRMIGEGELAGQTRQTVEKEGLQDCVCLTGAMSFEKVRKEMERSQIFLFTSDGEEGWGSVLNESMNAGMAVVASHEIGATPYLIKDGENGLIFKTNDAEDLYRKVKRLLDDQDTARSLGEKACQTIEKEWNGQEAAKRLIQLIESLAVGNDTPFADGPCSKAPVIKDGWYKGEKR